MSTPPTWTCPACGGAWIRNFVFDHSPTACRIRAAEDATQAADAERAELRPVFTRPATTTELELLAHMRGTTADDPQPATDVDCLDIASRRRRIDGFNPDDERTTA